MSIVDFDTLRSAYQRADEKPDRDTLIQWALRSTKNLRGQWCKVFGLDEEATAWCMEQIDPPFEDWGPFHAMTSVQVESFRLRVEKAEKVAAVAQSSSFDPQDYKFIAHHVLMLWANIEPEKRGRAPLPILNNGERCRDFDAFERTRLLPWVSAATPPPTYASTAKERIWRALAWWEEAVAAVYDTPRLNGSIPGRRGASLEWLCAPVTAEDGTIWPVWRLSQVLAGGYRVTESDAASVAARSEEDRA